MILDQILEGSKTIGFSFRNERSKNSFPRSCKSELWFDKNGTKSCKIRGKVFLDRQFLIVSLQVLRWFWSVKIFPQILHNSLLARWKLDLCIFDENLKNLVTPFPPLDGFWGLMGVDGVIKFCIQFWNFFDNDFIKNNKFIWGILERLSCRCRTFYLDISWPVLFDQHERLLKNTILKNSLVETFVINLTSNFLKMNFW